MFGESLQVHVQAEAELGEEPLDLFAGIGSESLDSAQVIFGLLRKLPDVSDPGTDQEVDPADRDRKVLDAQEERLVPLGLSRLHFRPVFGAQYSHRRAVLGLHACHLRGQAFGERQDFRGLFVPQFREHASDLEIERDAAEERQGPFRRVLFHGRHCDGVASGLRLPKVRAERRFLDLEPGEDFTFREPELGVAERSDVLDLLGYGHGVSWGRRTGCPDLII